MYYRKYVMIDDELGDFLFFFNFFLSIPLTLYRFFFLLLSNRRRSYTKMSYVEIINTGDVGRILRFSDNRRMQNA